MNTRKVETTTILYLSDFTIFNNWETLIERILESTQYWGEFS